jgi:hypothetical protein
MHMTILKTRKQLRYLFFEKKKIVEAPLIGVCTYVHKLPLIFRIHAYEIHFCKSEGNSCGWDSI